MLARSGTHRVRATWVTAPTHNLYEAFRTVKRIPSQACREPQLAVLSAMAHGRDDDAAARIALAALQACLGLDLERATFCADVVRTALGESARLALEALMQSPEYREFQSEFARKYTALGRAEGKAEDVLAVLEAVA